MQKYKRCRNLDNDRTVGLHALLLAMTCLFLTLTGPAFAGERENEATPLLDEINLGVTSSEKAHDVSAANGKVITGGLGQKAKHFGREMSFRVQVDPEKQNYVTFKCWGSETGGNGNVLYLYHDGSRISSNGKWDFVLDSTRTSPFPGRFYYVTRPIPYELTEGKKHIRLSLRATGRRSGSDRFEEGSFGHVRSIYRIYTHVNRFFKPSPDEPQGKPFEWGPDRPVPDKYAGREVKELLSETVNNKVKNHLKKSLSDMRWIHCKELKEIYYREWSDFYKSEEIEHVVKRWFEQELEKQLLKPLDQNVRKNKMSGGRWGKEGRHTARPLLWAYDAIEKRGMFEERIDHDGDPETEPIPRREAYVDFFKKARQKIWRSRNSNAYTVNIPLARWTGAWNIHKLLTKLDPGAAFSEDKVLKHLYELTGLVTWTGGRGMYPLGVTDKGIAIERWGYSPAYGKRHYKVYNVSELTGDERIRQKAAQMARAWRYFQYPVNDEDGYRDLRPESVIGHRRHPYRIRKSPFDSKRALQGAARYGDPYSLRVAQLYLKSNRIYEDFIHRSEDHYLRRLIDVADAYFKAKEKLKDAEQIPLLPMEPGHPDTVFSDEDTGTIAVKHGDKRMYVNLWRSRSYDFYVRNTAMVHYTTPVIDRVASVKYDATIKHKGEYITLAKKSGKRLEAEVPPSRHPEFGAFNRLQYGDYIIAMNPTYEETFELQTSETFARDLASGRIYYEPGGITIDVPPRTTVVLYTGDDR